MATRIELIGGPKHGEFIEVEPCEYVTFPSVGMHVCDPAKMPCVEYVTYSFTSPDRTRAFYYKGDGHDELHPRQETK